jgi:hypothetical protein
VGTLILLAVALVAGGVTTLVGVLVYVRVRFANTLWPMLLHARARRRRAVMNRYHRIGW